MFSYCLREGKRKLDCQAGYLALFFYSATAPLGPFGDHAMTFAFITLQS
jgi:hypothetical protein